MSTREEAELRRHNERIARSNAKPEPVPDAPDDNDIQSVIDAYNEAERLRYERLGAIYMHCVKHRKRAVNFAGGPGRWSNFPYDSERPDIGLDRYVSPLICYILSVE